MQATGGAGTEEDAEEGAVAEGKRESEATEGSGTREGAAAQAAVPVGASAMAVGVVVNEGGAGACQ